MDRLGAYEDTGLEPEEVEQIKRAAVYMMFEDVAHFVRYTLSNFDELQKYKALGDYNRLCELKQADDEGRCVVLPSGDYTDKDGENALKSAMNTCFYHNNPVTRYIADAVAEKLTREEAEAALKEAEPSGT